MAKVKKLKKAVKKELTKAKGKAKVGGAKSIKKAPTVTKVVKVGIPKAPYKKSELLGVLAEQTQLTKKEVGSVLETIQAIAKVHLVKNGPGQFTLPGLFKMTTKIKPATKAKKGRNPFTGEEIMVKAKPARRVVKVRVLKKFKNELE